MSFKTSRSCTKVWTHKNARPGRTARRLKSAMIVIVLLAAGAAVAQIEQSVPVAFTWEPSPLRDDQGRPLAPAVRYDVYLELDGAPGELVGAVEHSMLSGQDPTYVLAAARGVVQRIRVIGFDDADRQSPQSAWSDTVYVEPPLNVAGLVLRQAGVDIVTVAAGGVTGEIEFRPDQIAEPIEVVFFDADSVEFELDDIRFSLAWSLDDGSLFDISDLGAWTFAVEGLEEEIVEGEAGLTLTLLQNSWLPNALVDFVSQPITIRVVAERGDPDGASDGMPQRPELKPNYPNPFNPETRLVYGVPEGTPDGTRMALEIYNMRGQRVRSFPVGGSPVGWHEVTWDGRNDRGQMQATGTYIMRFVCGGRVDVGKMSMVK